MIEIPERLNNEKAIRLSANEVPRAVPREGMLPQDETNFR
jgi:hypothetical protein